jgi:16S rRNA (cytidine1402-2'-O)-methyltransferase
MKNGILYLIPSVITEDNIKDQIPSGHLNYINQIDEFAVENLRTARRYLRSIGFTKDFDEMAFHVVDKRTDDTTIEQIIGSLIQGKNIGLLSEAGLPCVADPGARLVFKAHEKDISVFPLSGPSSIFLALMTSGFNGQNFSFHGYLPIDKNQLTQKIKKIEDESYKNGYSQLFMETPYRNMQLIDSLLKICKSSTYLSIAANVLAENQYLKTKSIEQWRMSPLPELHKKPCVFILSSQNKAK